MNVEEKHTVIEPCFITSVTNEARWLCRKVVVGNKAEVLQGSDTKPKVFSARLIKKCSVWRCECVHCAVGGKYSVSVGPRMGNCRRGASLHPRTPRLTAFSVSVSAAPWPALSHADNTANTLFQIIVNNGNTLTTM